jgi:hypothetical protein
MTAVEATQHSAKLTHQIRTGARSGAQKGDWTDGAQENSAASSKKKLVLFGGLAIPLAIYEVTF